MAWGTFTEIYLLDETKSNTASDDTLAYARVSRTSSSAKNGTAALLAQAAAFEKLAKEIRACVDEGTPITLISNV